ncbi:hypothetical protein CIB48_g8381 [Xylaria polymorpha]|nr:hypothetical protein CIB48_g8381 [Xylaria polymorpha]
MWADGASHIGSPSDSRAGQLRFSEIGKSTPSRRAAQWHLGPRHHLLRPADRHAHPNRPGGILLVPVQVRARGARDPRHQRGDLPADARGAQAAGADRAIGVRALLPHHGRRRRALDAAGARVHQRRRRGGRQLRAGAAARVLREGDDGRVIDGFFGDVAAKSALPVVLYNFPGVCNGVDLDSATIARLAKQHDNIVGVKLTCGSVAKITRLAGSLPPERFAVFGGQSDFLIGGLSVGSAGCIAAFANVFPRSIVQIYKLYKEGKYQEALALHQKAALAEQPCKSGIAATKYAAAINTAKAAGIEGAEEKLKPRRPYTEPSAAAKQDVVAQMAELAKIEESLR